jgi:hypothetical protein
MGIHQLSVHNDERQDRLLLRISTQEGQEFRFWLTRRMVGRLLPAIEQAVTTLESQRSGLLTPDAPTRQMLTDMQREAFMQQADFNTPYAPPAGGQLPLGERPLLITDAQLRVLPQQVLQLVLKDHSDAQARQCELQLPAALVHGLLHLGRQATAKADWALEPKAEASAPAVAATSPSYAH